MDELARFASAAGAMDVLVASTSKDRERIWAPRRELSRALKAQAKFKISEDIAVPRGRIAEAIVCIRRMAKEQGVTAATYGHAGDGNLHVNLLWNDENQRETVKELSDDIFRLAVEMGGTITGEHGVGLAKRHVLPLGWGLNVWAWNGESNALDPKNLFNPGEGSIVSIETIGTVLRSSEAWLARRGVDQPRGARTKLAAALGMERLQLYLQTDRPLNETELAIPPLVGGSWATTPMAESAKLLDA